MSISETIASLEGRLELPGLADLLRRRPQAERLYTLSGPSPASDLLVESFTAIESVNQPFEIRLQVLSLDAHVDLGALREQAVTLHTTLADGSRSGRSAIVIDAEQLAADGGFARYRLTLRPWIAMLDGGHHNRVWQDKSVTQIVDDVLAPYAERGTWCQWRWGEADAQGQAEDIEAFLAQGEGAGKLPYCTQYRETDLHFLQRLLARVGLGWRIEQVDESGSTSSTQEPTHGQRVVFFADSSRWRENPTSLSALGGRGIRFHRAAAVEQQDAVQALAGVRQLNTTASTSSRWDYRSKTVVASTVPTNHQFGGESIAGSAHWLEGYDAAGAWADTGADASRDEARQRALLTQQAWEARNKTWVGRSSVRSLRAGEWMRIVGSPLDTPSSSQPTGAAQEEGRREFCVLRVISLGINNLPRDGNQSIAASLLRADIALDAFDPFCEALQEALDADGELLTQATAIGYANRFEGIRRAIPWLELPPTEPNTPGPQTAIVVGPEGNERPNGADELHTDALGRVKVRLHWQSTDVADPRDDNRSSCWVRVAQDWAGAGMGVQFIPRIGQEVLVNFFHGDADRPMVVSALYNGRGEAGLPPTPGGEQAEHDASAFAQSNDHGPGAQGNLIGSGTGGHSPAWHAAAAGAALPDAPAQNNAGAFSGVKSKEFGGEGFNQLVLDDTPQQLRVQLATTAHATQLNLGHLVHQADNHRGSFRGVGFELRTDAFGAVRGAQGLLITTYSLRAGEPAGDNAAGMALLKQATALNDTFHGAAKTHQATALAAAQGTLKANASALNGDAAPLQALRTTAATTVAAIGHDAARSDAASRNTQAGNDKLPHTGDPIVAVAAKAGLAQVAGQDVQWAAGDALALSAGQDAHLATGAQLRLHTSQSVGVLAGVVQAGSGAKGTGLTMIAAKGPVQMQAQAGTAQVAAKALVNVQTANANVDVAAAKKVTLATSGGASIVIDQSGVKAQCPGKITVKAAQHDWDGPAKDIATLPQLPGDICLECLKKAMASGSPLAALN